MLGPTIIDPNDENPRCKKCGNSLPIDLEGERKCSYCNHKFVVDESRIQKVKVVEKKESGSIDIPLDISFPEMGESQKEMLILLKDIKTLFEEQLKVNKEILGIIKEEKKIIDLHRRFRKD